MKKMYLLAFIFILAACSTQPIQVTVTPTLPPPTATVLSTPTLNPEFLTMQTQVAGSTENYTIMGNGQIEGKLPDGTIGIVPGITLNKDGKGYTLTLPDGQTAIVPPEDVTITDEGGVQVEGYQNIDGDEDYELVVGFDLDKWAGTDQVRLDFVATLDALGYPRENMTCNNDGACFDLEGNQIGKDGIFNFTKAKGLSKNNLNTF